MSKDNFVSDIKLLPAKSVFCSALMVTEAVSAKTKNGSDYLNLTLSDRTGSIKAKIWDVSPETIGLVTQGTVHLFSGFVDSYDKKPQLIIKNVLKEDVFDLNDYLISSIYSIEEMKADLFSLIETIDDIDFKKLVKETLNRPETRDFFTWPAAKAIHHAYRGGLLEHSLSVAKLAESVSSLYEGELNRDLLLAGAILHDVGKCWEFSGILATEYTVRGRLMGHLSMGALFLELVADTWPDYPQEKLLLLEHMLLAHHGEQEKGSPVTPKILEALALHYIDELDARINQLSRFIREETSGKEWVMTSFNKLADSFFLSTPRWGQCGDKDPGRPHGLKGGHGHDTGEPLASEVALRPGQGKQPCPGLAEKPAPFDWSKISLSGSPEPKPVAAKGLGTIEGGSPKPMLVPSLATRRVSPFTQEPGDLSSASSQPLNKPGFPRLVPNGEFQPNPYGPCGFSLDVTSHSDAPGLDPPVIGVWPQPVQPVQPGPSDAPGLDPPVIGVWPQPVQPGPSDFSPGAPSPEGGVESVVPGEGGLDGPYFPGDQDGPFYAQDSELAVQRNDCEGVTDIPEDSEDRFLLRYRVPDKRSKPPKAAGAVSGQVPEIESQNADDLQGHGQAGRARRKKTGEPKDPAHEGDPKNRLF
ncbi:MAG: HD domain-containing protein [Deltaproteobacteria bacterium]|jgi:3'-5' exoribonuclease|nr:HD domain-containing protein [Deltaproteobacteria bacterium]